MQVRQKHCWEALWGDSCCGLLGSHPALCLVLSARRFSWSWFCLALQPHACPSTWISLGLFAEQQEGSRAALRTRSQPQPWGRWKSHLLPQQWRGCPGWGRQRDSSSPLVSGVLFSPSWCSHTQMCGGHQRGLSLSAMGWSPAGGLRGEQRGEQMQRHAQPRRLLMEMELGWGNEGTEHFSLGPPPARPCKMWR